MTDKYLLIGSRDPFESKDTDSYYDLAAGLAKAGNTVTLFLVQNAVMATRPCTLSTSLSELANAGVEVLADDFSLRERGISLDQLAAGVKASPLDVVIDQLADGCKTLWH